MSQEERRGISEGIKDSLAHMKATHERIVGGPYGWQDTHDGIHLKANAVEQEIVQVALDIPRAGRSQIVTLKTTSRNALRAAQEIHG